MAGTIYIRQSSFADGDTITAALFNNEFNQLANAFAYTTSGTTGHTHDGTDGQGGNVSKIGDQDFKNKIVVDTSNNRWGIFVEVAGVTTEQVRIQDGAFVPVVDSDINLGSPTAYFKDSYIDTVTTTGAVTVGGALSAASFAIGGTALTATITELNTLDGITSTVTELNYTDGVTSNIQTQLNAKQPLDAQLTDIAALTPTDGTFIVGDGTNFVAEAPATALASLGVTSTATELNVLDGITTTTTELNYVHNVTSPIQTQLNAKQALNAKLTDISNLTLSDNFFLVSTGSNLALESPAAALTSLGVTATAAELNYVDGVTSNVQTQLDTKSPLSSPTFTGTLTAPIINASSDLKIGGTTIAATATELNYLSGVTSSVQTQLDALQASDTDLSAIAALTPSDGNFIVGNGTSWVAETGATVRTSLGLTIGTDVAPIASPTFTGTVTADGLSLGDNDKALFGSSSQLAVWSNGTNSLIQESGAGSLFVDATDIYLRGTGGTGTYLSALSGGGVSLYYNNSTKLSTSDTGATITGTATMDGLTVDSNDAQNVLLRDDNSFSGADNQIKLAIAPSVSVGNSAGVAFGTFSSDDYWKQGIFWQRVGNFGVGDLIIANRGNADTVTVTDADQRLRIASNGDISFYEDTGTTPKFFWDASAESLGIGTSSPAAKLDISGQVAVEGTGQYGIFHAGSGGPLIGFESGSNLRFGSVSSKTASGFSEYMRIDSSGNVGIGTSSPTYLLTLKDSNGADLAFSNSTASPSAGDYLGRIYAIDNGDNFFAGINMFYHDADDGEIRFRVRTAGTNTDVMTLVDGNVGIGTSSPDQLLHISASSNPTIRIENTDTTAAVNQTIGKIEFEGQDASTNASGVRAEIEAEYGGVGGASRLRFKLTNESSTTLSDSIFLSYNTQTFYTGNTERMRIDSGGNVLVGKTAANTNVVGVEFKPSGQVLSTADGTNPLLLNRKTSDGEIVRLQKDGTAVGSIGVSYGDRINIGTGNTGLMFRASSRSIDPADPSTGLIANGSIDLGRSANPFKDLYLSGTAYVGTSVGIGTSSPASPLHIDYDGTAMRIVRGSAIGFLYNTGTAASSDFRIQSNGGGLDFYYGSSRTVTFTDTGAERMRIDASGNLLVGKTAASGSTQGAELRADGRLLAVSTSDFAGYFNRKTTDGEIVRFVKDTTTVGSIGVSGGALQISGNTNSGLQFNSSAFVPMQNGATIDATIDLGSSVRSFKDLYLSGGVNLEGATGNTLFKSGSDLVFTNREAGALIVGTNNTERMRIDSSGNLLVGTTTSVSTSSSQTGAEIRANGISVSAVNSNPCTIANRIGTDGDIAIFRKNGTDVGSILNDGTAAYFNSTADGGLARAGTVYFKWSSAQFYPNVDDSSDLGIVSRRFDDIYATNATIQTSDRNEKQDIEVLSEAEQRVAVACKGLLRKFRWKSAVEEKGDDARIHFGIIAQDLQAAFEAEGLDAGRYAMFIHSTWTDEETGEERSRMGVRYSELLAFIIAAL